VKRVKGGSREPLSLSDTYKQARKEGIPPREAKKEVYHPGRLRRRYTQGGMRGVTPRGIPRVV